MDYAQDVGRGFGDYWRGVIFRREYKHLDDIVSKSKRWFRRIFPKARWLSSSSSYKWVFEGGEELLFRQFKDVDDYWNYHGHELPFIGWEELTSWPTIDCYDSMKSCNRSTYQGETPIPLKIRGTTNAYGIGHAWVKRHFIDPAPSCTPITDEQGNTRIVITGYLKENRFLGDDYLKMLKSVKDEAKRKAWTGGSERWNIVAGGAVSDVWRRKYHVLEPFEIPKAWTINRSFDWGSSKPFSVGWWAESDGSEVEVSPGKTRTFPKGTLFRIVEHYGWNGQPNQGVYRSAGKVAKEIKEIEKKSSILNKHLVRPGPADTSIWDADDEGKSIASKMQIQGVKWTKADKRPGSRKAGLEEVRDRLISGSKNPMEEPGLFIFSTCSHFIRTVPVLPRDPKDMDDVDTDAEDHVYDEVRYRLGIKKKKTTTQSLGL
ncbi:MAG: hypothetical protein MI862_27095 [Desulfobacterales bacterium]|nr:hypothetical protein [Desulfobacterales bacterium]